ncbi:TonB-dependent receptor [Elongatibacter sediminis]|uniref:TonB-dependent receptor n=1 Tax=Elongatibacter sediminis TaxID=3119006 RepID=A0AAW9RC64_9GAMM
MITPKRRRNSTLLCLCLLGPGLVNVAAAQDGSRTSSQLEEVIVTAERRVQSLQDVPISISVFDSEALEATNVKDLRGYFVQTPNVSYQEAGRSGPRSVDIAIRGVSNIGGSVNAFGVYLDEFNVANVAQEGAVNLVLEDIERVEVLRGPQGTFFGRNATGGALNITSNQPGPEYEGKVSAHYGSHDTWGLTGVVNVPVVTERFFLRAMFNHEESNGFIKNVNESGGRSDYSLTSTKLAGRWLATDDFTVDFAAYITRDDSGLDPLVPTGVLDADTASIVGTTVPVSNGLPFYPENTTLVNHDRRERQNNDSDILTLRMTYEADNFQIRSITGFIDTERDYHDDLDFTSESLVYQDALDKTSSWSQEVRVQSTADSAVEWTVGALYAEDEVDSDFGVFAGSDGFFGLPDGFPIDVGDNYNKATSWAVFGQALWQVSDRVAITAGARYSHDKVEGRADGIGFGTTLDTQTGEQSFDDFSPRLSVSYDWNDDVTTYVTISKGYKAGGLQFNESVTEQSYDEEILWNYEAGARMFFLNRSLMLNATVFYMDWEDLQVTSFETLTNPDTGEIVLVTTTNNAASASSKGFELEFAAQLGDAWSVSGGAGYLDAKFDSFPNAVITGAQVDLSGEDMIRAPEWTLNLQSQYSFPIQISGFSGLEGYVRGEWSYRSETVPNIEAILTPGFPNETPAFDVLNLRLGAESDAGRFEVFVENALDEDYYTGQSNFGFGGIRVRPHPRIWGVRFATEFQ